MRNKRRILPFLILLLLTGCASGPDKFYRGPTRSDEDTATIIAHRGFSLSIDGRSLYGSASVLPGRRRIVVKGPKNVGYVELDARAGHTYTARTILAESGGHTWAVDLATCTVVVGTLPENFSSMNPTDRGCAEEELTPEEIAGMIAAGLMILPLVVIAPEALSAPWSSLSGPENCAEQCYTEPDTRLEPTANLLVPPWREQAAEDCDAIVYFHLRCLTDIRIDDLHVRKNSRRLALSLGRHEIVIWVVGARGIPFWSTDAYHAVDGVSFEAEANRIYALCISRDLDERKMSTWIVDDETGQVVAGRKRAFDAEEVSSYSRHCPAY